MQSRTTPSRPTTARTTAWPCVPLHGRPNFLLVQKWTSGDSNPRPRQTKPRLRPRQRRPRIALRGLGARLIIHHASSTADAAGPANANGSTTAASSVNVAFTRRLYRRHCCELPRLDFGSDWTTGTAALVFRGLTSSATQIARYLAVSSSGKEIYWRCRLSYRHQGGRDHHARRWTPAARTLVSRGSTKTILKLRCGAFQRATSGPHRTPLSAIADNAKSAHNRAYHCHGRTQFSTCGPPVQKGTSGGIEPGT